MVGTDAGELGVGFGHKGLQLILKDLVSGLGSGRLDGSPLRPALLGTGLEAAFPALGTIIALAEAALGPTGIFALGLGLQTFDGQVDLAVFIADDHHLHILTLGQMLADVADIGVGDLRNMYHAGLVLRQGNERAEIGDGLDFAFENGSNG